MVGFFVDICICCKDNAKRIICNIEIEEFILFYKFVLKQFNCCQTL